MSKNIESFVLFIIGSLKKSTGEYRFGWNLSTASVYIFFSLIFCIIYGITSCYFMLVINLVQFISALVILFFLRDKTKRTLFFSFVFLVAFSMNFLGVSMVMLNANGFFWGISFCIYATMFFLHYFLTKKKIKSDFFSHKKKESRTKIFLFATIGSCLGVILGHILKMIASEIFIGYIFFIISMIFAIIAPVGIRYLMALYYLKR